MLDTFDNRTVDPTRLMQAMQEVIGQFAGAQNMKKATGTSVGPYVHGPGGIFGVRGLSRGVISTFTQITGSLAEQIPVGSSGAEMMQNSNEINPLFPYIVDFLRSDQQEKNAPCDDPPPAGLMTVCMQTTVFGRKEFKTNTVEINQIGKRINRGEFFDQKLLNEPLVNSMGGLMRDTFNLSDVSAALAGREMVLRMMEVAFAYQRWFCPQTYIGNPVNSRAGGGYKEFPGLDLLIGTNKIDAISGVACPGLYSDIKNFAYKDVTSTVGPTIVTTFQALFHTLNRRATQNNLSPVDWKIVMRSDLFYALTSVWPYQYNTDVAAFAAASGGNVTLVNDFAVKQRDDMRNGLYLLIDGIRRDVILDDCIAEDNHNSNAAIGIGGFASDIYVVPFSARGGTIKTLFWDHYDYGATNGTMQAVEDMRASNFFWSDQGIFLWGLRPPNNWCVDMISKVEPRLILRTPQLAGRLTHVQYTPLQHTNDPLPSSAYHVGGGVSTGYAGPSPYSEWNTPGPGIAP